LGNNKILEFKNISKIYPGVKALESVSFGINREEIHAIVGENGAGKSTLLKILCGLTYMNSGQILLNNKVINIMNNHQTRQLGISIIPQEISLIPKMTVADNVFLGHYPLKITGIVNSNKLFAETNKLIRMLKTEHIHPRDLIDNYSTAKKQIVEIIKALSFNVSILALDEPTSSISRIEIDNLFRLLRSLKASGKTIIFVSHQLKEVFEIADRITVLKDGRYIATRNKKDTSIDEIVRLMVGRELKDYYPKRTKNDIKSKNILEVKNLKKDGLFSDINFTLKKGEILGVFGLVGSGRTEIVKAIFGALKLNDGEIYLEGEQLRTTGIENTIKCGIGLVPEDRHGEGLILCLSVMENLTLPVLRWMNKKGFIKLKEQEKTTIRFIKDLNIKTSSKNTIISNLSGGNQQKVSIAKWLAAKSKILILDEPTRGVDVGAKAEIYKIMRNLTNKGLSIIMISSELPEILHLSDRILAVSKGKIACIFDSPENLKEEDILSKCVYN
jgi:ribose transport system ATP-binding protein